MKQRGGLVKLLICLFVVVSSLSSVLAVDFSENCIVLQDPEHFHQQCTYLAQDPLSVARPVFQLIFEEHPVQVEFSTLTLLALPDDPFQLAVDSGTETFSDFFNVTPLALGLPNGDYQLFMRFYDEDNNLLDVVLLFNLGADDLYITVEDPVPEQFISLDPVDFAFSPDGQSLDLSLQAEREVSCRYAFGSVAEFAQQSVEDLYDQFSSQVFEGTCGQTYCQELSQTIDLSSLPENRTAALHLFCEEQGRYFHPLIFVGWDTSVPDLVLLANPHPITNPLHIATHLSVNSTPDYTICSLSNTNDNLPLLFGEDTAYFTEDVHSFSSFREGRTADFFYEFGEGHPTFPLYQNTYELYCVNPAGWEREQQFTIDIQLDLNGTITLLSPLFTNLQNYPLRLFTGYPSTCQVSVQGGPLEVITSTPSQFHDRIIPLPGEFTNLSFTCIKQGSIDSVSTSATITLDNLLPSPPSSSLTQYSCSEDFFKPLLKSRDNYGIAFFNYTLSGTNIELEGQVFANEENQAQLNIPLPSNLSQFTFTAFAVDLAGNVGQQVSFEITVTNSSLDACDLIPPEGSLAYEENELGELLVSLLCQDGQSGCSEMFSYGIAPLERTSCVYTQTFYEFNNRSNARSSPILVEQDTHFCYNITDNNNNYFSAITFITGYPNYCSNNLQDADETAVDCGGSCAPCELGAVCEDHSDCASNYCVEGVCAAASCTDVVLNGLETDVDCGGSCLPCANGLFCFEGRDCLSGQCLQGVCTAPTCFDGLLNQNEQDVDCGGSCAPCSWQASCTDGVQNGEELGVDCGGSCDACGIGPFSKLGFWIFLLGLLLILGGGTGLFIAYYQRQNAPPQKQRTFSETSADYDLFGADYADEQAAVDQAGSADLKSSSSSPLRTAEDELALKKHRLSESKKKRKELLSSFDEEDESTPSSALQPKEATSPKDGGANKTTEPSKPPSSSEQTSAKEKQKTTAELTKSTKKNSSPSAPSKKPASSAVSSKKTTSSNTSVSSSDSSSSDPFVQLAKHVNAPLGHTEKLKDKDTHSTNDLLQLFVQAKKPVERETLERYLLTSLDSKRITEKSAKELLLELHDVKLLSEQDVLYLLSRIAKHL
ncbi:MAG: hypothetical protein H6502_02075 [Candidatus Woesearchaeota archaeon]|nr:MAG: hypothetical protein H6502_02075 [Candidatus Woesearchaeota archaeon]